MDFLLAPFRRLDASLREKFPGEPTPAHWLRFGDTLIGLAEQAVLFALVTFLVFVTSLWFAGDHVMIMTVLFAAMGLGGVAGLVIGKDPAHRGMMLTLIGIGAVLGAATQWVSSTGKPLEGADYDVRYACFLLAMVGGAFAAHHRRLLSMDFVSHFLPGKVKPWTRVANTTFALVIAYVFVKFGTKIWDAQSAERHTRGAQEHWIPEAGANAAMMIGAVLLFVHLAVQILIDLDYLVRGKTPPEPQMGAA